MPKLIPVNIKGKVYPSVSAACRALNLNVHAVFNCMHQQNALTAEEAIKHILCNQKKRQKRNDLIARIMKQTECSRGTIDERLWHGWTLEETVTVPFGMRRDTFRRLQEKG